MSDSVEMVVRAIADGNSVTTKTGKMTYRFDADIGGAQTSVTIWGDDCLNLPGEGIKIGYMVAGQFVRKADYKGKAQYWASPTSVDRGVPVMATSPAQAQAMVAPQAPPPPQQQAPPPPQQQAPPPPPQAPPASPHQAWEAPRAPLPPVVLPPAPQSSGSYGANCMDYAQTLKFIGVTYSKLLELVYVAMGTSAKLEVAGTVAQGLTSTIYIAWQHGHVRVKEPTAKDAAVDVKDLVAQIAQGMERS